MEELDKYIEMIPAYLTGKLSQDERKELEARLKDSRELRNTIEEYRGLASGLRLLDAATAGHPEAKLLIQYVDSPDSLKPEDRSGIKQHLENCPECRDLALMCQPVPPVPPESFFARLLNWLMIPRLMRPAYVAILLALMAAPLAWVSFRPSSPALSEVQVTLKPTTRDVRSANTMKIEPGATVVRLEFAVPVIEDRRYDFKLYDPEGRLMFTQHDNAPNKLLALEVPASYFDAGIYTLRIIELEAGVEQQESFEFHLNVSRSQP